jgi:hypothetical protein
VRISIPVPEASPPGCYRGALLLHGFEKGALPVRITVAENPDEEATAPLVRAS